ncbi:hypothetical protein OAB57_01245 [Bacteriovoracaceae bacterium]|nr:hypothetical protein [Bacteriovoracaceae bacterium]
MINSINTTVSKLSLGHRLTSLLVFLLIAFVLGSPHMVKHWGGAILAEGNLGPKIMSETLFATYCLIGTILFALVIYQGFQILRLEKRFSVLFKDLDLIRRKSESTQKMLKSYESNRKMENQEYKGIMGNLKKEMDLFEVKFSQTSSIIVSLVTDISCGSNTILEMSEECVKMESLGIGENEKQLMEEIYSKFNQINENIFKIQLQTFNASIESHKGENTDREIPFIASEIEGLVIESSKLLEEVYVVIEEEQKNALDNVDKFSEFLLNLSQNISVLGNLVENIKENIDSVQTLGSLDRFLEVKDVLGQFDEFIEEKSKIDGSYAKSLNDYLGTINEKLRGLFQVKEADFMKDYAFPQKYKKDTSAPEREVSELETSEIPFVNDNIEKEKVVVSTIQ